MDVSVEVILMVFGPVALWSLLYCDVTGSEVVLLISSSMYNISVNNSNIVSVWRLGLGAQPPGVFLNQIVFLN